MISQEQGKRMNAVMSKIEKLIEGGHLIEARAALDKIAEKIPGDPEVCSMMAIIHILEGSFDGAEDLLTEGLKGDSFHFDLLFNLAYVNEQRGQYKTANMMYSKACTVARDNTQKQNVEAALNRLKELDDSLAVENRAKIVIFVKAGMDSFLGDIIKGLLDDYWVRKIIVGDFKQIDEGMEWADICWFEWCDELVAYGSRLPLAQQRKIICRLHSYEAFTDYTQKVTWTNVDKVVFIAEHIREYVLTGCRSLASEKTVVIPNGIDVGRYPFRKRNNGFNIAYVGYINYKKGPMLLLHTFYAIHKRDKRYKLYIAGKYQDPRYELYFWQMAEELGIAENIIFEGWQEDINQWLEDKNYILCTSLLESQNLSIMQAMCKGIKPVIHNFVGAREIYPDQYIWNTIDEAAEAVISGVYETGEYRRFVIANYSLESELGKITGQISELLSFRRIIDRVKDILESKEQPAELLHKNLTVLIPNYNRGRMLKEDMDKGLKLGNQSKMIVDDCSTEETEQLDFINNNKEIYNADIIWKQLNEGLAESRRTGLQKIRTRFTAFVDDDDMLLCIDGEQALIDIEKLNNEYILMIPRYLLNFSNGVIELGYDRNCYKDRSAAEVLKNIASNSEIRAMLAGGSIGCTDILKVHSSAKEFRVAEDFVMLSRLLSANPEMKLGTTQSLVHIRRTSDDSLSKTLSSHKLALGLIAQCVACYHCLQLGIASKDEALEWMNNRAALIQKLYGYGESFETELMAYLTGEISEEVFVHFLKLQGLGISNNLDKLAPELRKMRSIFCNKPKTMYSFKEQEKPVLVSIIIPTFNRKDMLKRAIDNALKQDYPNIEVIVTDNCSNDGTYEMVTNNYKNEKRLIYNRNEKNIGPTLNYKKAFYEIAKGDYCMTQSDDDYLIDSTYISKAVKMLNENSRLAFVFAGYYYNHEGKNKVYRVKPNYQSIINGEEFFINYLMEKYPYMPNLCTTLFRKDIAHKIEILKCDPDCLAADLTILLRLLLKGDAGFIDDIVLTYTLHKDSLSLNSGTTIKSKGDNYNEKVLLTAKADIEEMEKIGDIAHGMGKFSREELDKWFIFRVFRYMYWRLNETVRTKQEAMLLLNYLKHEYPLLLDTLMDVAQNRFGEIVLEERS